ncbi:hypothetical protein E1A91_A04G014000v1 [Gossypium mustelinum]|uniref:Sulfotransferase n=1 Tax=Gossypium mustelinum TaxID=34275 RepID=A0A5D2ZJC2_GOSMU|nr:hypothetical protein E1A91_A04G014000v1 [Gossypium mustelinum]
MESQSRYVLQKSFKEMISTLPKKKCLGFPKDQYQYQGFWFASPFLQGAFSPRTGTAWLKSLTFATITRTSYNDSTTPLLSKMPHDVVPFMEFDHAQFSTNRHLGIPLLATHLPYSLLPRSIIDSGCKLIYICRDPKDTFVSWYHFFAGYCKSQNTQPIQLDEAFRRNNNKGVPENIVQMCSFENLSGLEVNKTGKHCEGQGNLGFENNIFFRKEKLGDWKNHLTIEMAQHLDQRTMQKLSGSSLSL